MEMLTHNSKLRNNSLQKQQKLLPICNTLSRSKNLVVVEDNLRVKILSNIG